MANCQKKKSMYVTPRDEYIQHFKNCSSETRNLLQTCLPEKLRYLPELIYASFESLIEFSYDDREEIQRSLVPCLPSLRGAKSQEKYHQCALNSSGSSDKVPGSKKSFCDKFIPINKCFVKQLNVTCNINTDLEKVMVDYMNAMEKPCK